MRAARRSGAACCCRCCRRGSRPRRSPGRGAGRRGLTPAAAIAGCRGQRLPGEAVSRAARAMVVRIMVGVLPVAKPGGGAGRAAAPEPGRARLPETGRAPRASSARRAARSRAASSCSHPGVQRSAADFPPSRIASRTAATTRAVRSSGSGRCPRPSRSSRWTVMAGVLPVAGPVAPGAGNDSTSGCPLCWIATAREARVTRVARVARVGLCYPAPSWGQGAPRGPPETRAPRHPGDRP